MKKVMFVSMLIVALGILILGCSNDKGVSKSKDPWEYIKSKGEFIVGMDDAFPPMGYKDEQGEIVGYDVDLAKAVAERLGVKVRFQPVVWDGITMELNNKNIDVIWNGFSITEKRKEIVDFTKPYLGNRQILVVANGSSIKGKGDLAGKKVGLQAGSSSRTALEKEPDIYEKVKDRLVEFSTNDEVLLDLKNGGIDAAILDEVVARFYIAKRPGDYEILVDDFGTEDYGIGVRKGETSFLNQLQGVLDELKEDGTMAEISKKWFGEDISK